MAGEIKSRKITAPEAVRFQDTVLAAEYLVDDKVIAILGIGGVQSAIRNALEPIRKEISRSVVRKFKQAFASAPNKGIISGDLLANATQNFNVFLLMRGRRIIVRAIWRAPTIPYFFAHLHGSKVNSARKFIRLDGIASKAIENLLESEIRIEVGQVVVKGRRPRKRKKGASVLRAEFGRAERRERRLVKPTGRQVRKRLREAGLSATEARRVQESMLQGIFKKILAFAPSELRIFLSVIQSLAGTGISKAVIGI